MEITSYSLWAVIHGMGFGALYLLGCAGLLVELRRAAFVRDSLNADGDNQRFVRAYFVVMVLLAWICCITGAFLVYPWYRAAAPVGTTDFSHFPQLLLRSHPNTAGWHTLGMEWKEHVAWFTPISVTAAAAVYFVYGRRLRVFNTLRHFVVGFVAVSFLCAGIAGFWGAMINKYAPVQGGRDIILMGNGAAK